MARYLKRVWFVVTAVCVSVPVVAGQCPAEFNREYHLGAPNGGNYFYNCAHQQSFLDTLPPESVVDTVGVIFKKRNPSKDHTHTTWFYFNNGSFQVDGITYHTNFNYSGAGTKKWTQIPSSGALSKTFAVGWRNYNVGGWNHMRVCHWWNSTAVKRLTVCVKVGNLMKVPVQFTTRTVMYGINFLGLKAPDKLILYVYSVDQSGHTHLLEKKVANQSGKVVRIYDVTIPPKDVEVITGHEVKYRWVAKYPNSTKRSALLPYNEFVSHKMPSIFFSEYQQVESQQ